MMEERKVLKYAVGIETYKDIHTHVFGKGVHLPVACTMNFTTAKDAQQEIYFHVLQGDSLAASECQDIGEFLIKNISPQKAGEAVVRLTLEINDQGKLSVHARELPDKELSVDGKAAPIQYTHIC